MITIFDTETTGIPNWKMPLTDGSQPRIIQLGALQFDRDGNLMNRVALYMKRDGWVSSSGAKAVHGISERRCDLYGVRQVAAIAVLMDMVRSSRVLASYGLRFDRTMVEIEMLRAGGIPDGWKRSMLRDVCILEAAAQAANSGKSMKLNDAHQAIVGSPYEQKHDALEDTEAAGRVFWALVTQKKIEV